MFSGKSLASDVSVQGLEPAYLHRTLMLLYNANLRCHVYPESYKEVDTSEDWDQLSQHLDSFSM